MNLESLDDKALQIIAKIVDNYVIGETQIKDGTNQYLYDAGIYIDSLFINIESNRTSNIILHKSKIDDSVDICYTFSSNYIKPLPDEDENDALHRFVNIQRSRFVYIVALLKWLYSSDLIFLIDDKNMNLFNEGYITEYDMNKWNQFNIKIYKERLKSKNIFDVLSKIHNCRIIPSSELINFRNKKFRTPDQLRFRKSYFISWLAIIISVIIGVGSPVYMSIYNKSDIEQSKFDTILKTLSRKNALALEEMDSINIEKNK